VVVPSASMLVLPANRYQKVPTILVFGDSDFFAIMQYKAHDEIYRSKLQNGFSRIYLPPSGGRDVRGNGFQTGQQSCKLRSETVVELKQERFCELPLSRVGLWLYPCSTCRSKHSRPAVAACRQRKRVSFTTTPAR
jgi:hypothetical protein